MSAGQRSFDDAADAQEYRYSQAWYENLPVVEFDDDDAADFVFDGACGDDNCEATIRYALEYGDVALFDKEMPIFYDVQFNKPHAIDFSECDREHVAALVLKMLERARDEAIDERDWGWQLRNDAMPTRSIPQN